MSNYSCKRKIHRLRLSRLNSKSRVLRMKIRTTKVVASSEWTSLKACTCHHLSRNWRFNISSLKSTASVTINKIGVSSTTGTSRRKSILVETGTSKTANISLIEKSVYLQNMKCHPKMAVQTSNCTSQRKRSSLESSFGLSNRCPRAMVCYLALSQVLFLAKMNHILTSSIRTKAHRAWS